MAPPGPSATPEQPPGAARGGRGESSLQRQGWWALFGVLALAGLLGLFAAWYHNAVSTDLAALDRARLQVLEAGAQLPALEPAAQALDASVSRLRAREHRTGWLWALLAIVVLLAIGVAQRAYLARLAADLAALRRRAQAVVAGERPSAPTLQRDDELGQLGAALDGMVAALAAREHDLEVERRKVFHQEKMAAVGAMAAGVLHDIGNPIAAIDGVARAMKDAHASGECVSAGGLCDPELILRETARLQGFTQMIAGLAATQSTEPQLLSLNELIQTALLLLRFDPRLAGVRIQTDLDPQLPAMTGVSDSLLQLVLNLLVNAADAVRASPRDRPMIEVKTGADAAGVRLTIADNGCGMNEDTLRRAFQPMFTTKPAGRGTGLGLPLVRAIAEQHGGDVTIASAPEQGARVDVRLALRPQLAH